MARLGDPLWLLLLVGGLLFALNAWLERAAGNGIRLGPETRAALIDNQRAVLGRPLTSDEIGRLETQWLVDELLFREAIAEGVHLSSSEVRAAIIETMRMRITGTLPEPDPEALVNFYAEHLDRYQAEPAIWFSHVFFQNQVNASATVLEQLEAGTEIEGDPFGQGRVFPGYGQSMLRGLFDGAFTRALWSAPLERWSGPLASRYGWHFVRPTRRTPARQLRFADVSAQVENDYLVNVINERINAFVEARAPAYDLALPPAATPAR